MGAGSIYLAVCVILPFSARIGALIRSIRLGHMWIGDPILLSPWVLLVALAFTRAWHGLGTQLLPHGLRASFPFGSFTVPWEALRVPHPTQPANASTVRLHYARPQLVRRRGVPLTRRTLLAGSTDARILASAIDHYAAHPEHRKLIGTPGEYERLMADFRG